MPTDSRFVTPKVYLCGYTEMHEPGVLRFLKESGNEDFWQSIQEARAKGISSAEILCSMFGKLCYRALTTGHNANITRVRDIENNIRGTFDQGHGSVFEHVGWNFVIDDCSRVFTHELVRHRIGTAFSQTSGRYCRLDRINMVWDPVLDPVKGLWEDHLKKTEDVIYLTECKLGLRKPAPGWEGAAPEACLVLRESDGWQDRAESRRWVPDESFDFATRKKITSAIRRIAPNGQDNEIAFSVNLRSLRHTIMLRTARFAEWEIRVVFAEIYRQLKELYPLIFHGAKEEIVDGLVEVSGMKCQPYEKAADVVLAEMTDEEVVYYLKTRPQALDKLRAELAV
jgi:thymidylate synthase (FAD)